MRRAKAILAVLIVLQSLATAGLAQGNTGAVLGPAGPASGSHVQAGIVTYVDPATMNFVCQGAGNSQEYWVTRRTRFHSRDPNATFFELFVGRPVEVTSHGSGAREIADVIRF